MKGRWQTILFGLTVLGVIRIGLALWKGSGRLEALLIVIVTFAVFGGYYLIFYHDGKVNS